MCAAEWKFQGRAGWLDFSTAVSGSLEADLRAGRATSRFKAGGKEYEVDFTEMRQYSVDDRSRVRKVQRNGASNALTNQIGTIEPLSNEFFWDAFKKAMSQAGYDITVGAEDFFDFARNRDYRSLKDTGHVMQRGGQPYKMPVGWKRVAVKAVGRYDGGDNTWMHMDGKAGEWAVAYHGTKYACLPHILHQGLKAGPRQAHAGKCGVGIYCTPDIATALGYSATVSLPGEDGEARAVQFIMQCRVRPGAIRKGTDTIWVINDATHIRPYGVLVRTA